MSYSMIITTAGVNALAAAVSSSNKVVISHVAVGDGAGAPITPTLGMTSLVHEVHRDIPQLVYIHPLHANWVVTDFLIPATVGGFDVREVGLFCNNGLTLFAVGNYPLTNKPVPETGSDKDLYMKLIVTTSSAAIITVNIDTSLILATQTWTDDNFVRVIGDTMTGPLVLSGAPTINTHASTKLYVDTTVSTGITNHVQAANPHPEYASDTDLENHRIATAPHPNLRYTGHDLTLYSILGGL